MRSGRWEGRYKLLASAHILLRILRPETALIRVCRYREDGDLDAGNGCVNCEHGREKDDSGHDGSKQCMKSGQRAQFGIRRASGWSTECGA